MGQLGNGNIREQQEAERRLREVHGIPHRIVAAEKLERGQIKDRDVKLDIYTAFGQDERVQKALQLN